MTDANTNLRIILIGATGCGKTTLGKMLAEALDVPFYDTDEMSVERIDDYFERLGFFRGLVAFSQVFITKQTEVLTDLANRDGPFVIAA